MSSNPQRTSHRRRLPHNHRESLQALVDAVGPRAAADRMGVHPQTLLALLAGVACNGSTVALVEHRLVVQGGEQVDEGGGADGTGG